MNYLKMLVFSLGLILMANVVMAKQTPDKILTIEDNGKEIELAPGEKITLQLQEPGGTGFAWRIDELDKSHLKLIGEERVKASLPQKYEGGLVPTGGAIVRLWSFKAVAPGDMQLKMLFYRAWEGKEHAGNKFEIKFHISGTNAKNYAHDEPDDEIQKEISKAGRHLDIYDNGRKIKVNLGEIIVVELKVQDETEANWHIDGLDESRLELIGKKAVSVSPKVASEGIVVEKFYIKTIGMGDTTFKLLYYLPAEGRDHAINKFEIKLHITDKQ